jgi:hypothetical protein
MNDQNKVGNLDANDWLVLVEDDGLDGMGRVLGWCVCSDKSIADNIPRGELFDALELFIDCEVPDNVYIEVIQVHDFDACYGDRMPLYGNNFRLS